MRFCFWPSCVLTGSIQTFEFIQSWEEAAPVWRIKAGANFIGVNGEKIIYGDGEGNAYNWIAFRLSSP